MSSPETYTLTFNGFLAVRLMEFDFDGRHFSYHGRKLENAVARLADARGPIRATAAELSVLNQAKQEWEAAR